MKESKIFSSQNLTAKVHYVYRVSIDGKYYIGKRSGFLNDLETGRYKTSSKLVHEKLQNGHYFSKIKILQVFSTAKDALEFEGRILTRVDAKANPKFLNQQNGNGNYTFKRHTEKSKKKLSEKSKAQFDENTEYGRKQREIQSKIQRNLWDENTELGRKRREHQSNKRKEYYNPETEEGRRNKEKRSQISKSILDINTEEGRKRRENHSKVMKERFNPETEEGRKRRENKTQLAQAQFDPNTEEGRRNREKHSEIMKKAFNPNTEHGRKNLEKLSKSHKARYNPNTEEGRRNLKIHSEIMKKGAKTSLQKRKNSSILGELMFDEDFIKENFLIIDDKNNLRFLSSVYSELSGYCESLICKEKRIGKLRFLYGIKSIIKISEEFKNSKIEAIEAIIKSMNEK